MQYGHIPLSSKTGLLTFNKYCSWSLFQYVTFRMRSWYIHDAFIRILNESDSIRTKWPNEYNDNWNVKLNSQLGQMYLVHISYFSLKQVSQLCLLAEHWMKQTAASPQFVYSFLIWRSYYCLRILFCHCPNSLAFVVVFMTNFFSVVGK